MFSLSVEGLAKNVKRRLLPTSTIFTTHRMSFEEDGPLESQLNARDVDGILHDVHGQQYKQGAPATSVRREVIRKKH